MRGGEGNLSPSKLSRQMQPLTFSTVGMNANRTFSSLLRLFFIPVPPRPPVQNAKILPGYIQVEVSFHQFSLFIFNFFNPRTLFFSSVIFLNNSSIPILWFLPWEYLHTCRLGFSPSSRSINLRSHFYLLWILGGIPKYSILHHELKFLENEYEFFILTLQLHFKFPYSFFLPQYWVFKQPSFSSYDLLFLFQSDYIFLHPNEDFLKCSPGFHWQSLSKVFFL